MRTLYTVTLAMVDMLGGQRCSYTDEGAASGAVGTTPENDIVADGQQGDYEGQDGLQAAHGTEDESEASEGDENASEGTGDENLGAGTGGESIDD